MAYLVDSCILLDILTDDPRWANLSQNLLDQCSQNGELFVNPIIYTEISIGYAKRAELDKVLEIMALSWEDTPREALFLAGKAFLSYRRNHGTKNRPMPDFYIGAHAQVNDHVIITRDVSRYNTYFPSVQLIVPDDK